MTDKPNRLDRSSATDLQIIGEAGAKAAFALAPGGGFLYDLFKARKDQLRDAVRKEDESRLDKFFSDLLGGETAVDPPVAEAMFDDRDFQSLVRACISDIEAEKVDAYAALARAIASGRVPSEWRRHFILSLRDMSSTELGHLRSAYVARNFDLVPHQLHNSSLRENDFLKAEQPGSLRTIALRKLEANGFVHDAALSTTGADFVLACTKAMNLSPAALGYKCWSGLNVAIIGYELGDETQVRLASEVSGALLGERIKNCIVAVTRSNGQQIRLANTHGLLLLGRNADGINEHIESLRDFSARVPVAVLRDAAQDIELPSEIKVSRVIDYDGSVQSAVEGVVETFRSYRRDSI